MAEYLMRRELGLRGLDWDVHSAGTQAEAGSPMHPHALAALTELGIDASDFRSRGCSAPVLAQSDLILAMDRAELDRVVTPHPFVLPVAWVFPQFVRLVDAAGGSARRTGLDDRELGREMLARARAGRRRVQSSSGDDDVVDPMGRRRSHFKACGRRLESLTDVLLSAIKGNEDHLLA